MRTEDDARACDAHLRLAQGFMETAAVTSISSEFEGRSALSRCYFALFHASRAWLFGRGVSPKGSISHKRLRKEILRSRGADAGQTLSRFSGLRNDADYRPDQLQQAPYNGDLELFRVLAERSLSEGRAEFDRIVLEVGRES